MRAYALFAALAVCACASREQASLKARITSARTADDHRAIAREFQARADHYEADAERHRALAATYEAEGTLQAFRSHDRSELRMAEHCRAVARRLEQTADELRGLAHEHDAVATTLDGQP